MRVTVSTKMQQGTAQQLYSKLTEKRPRKPRRYQKHKLTPVRSITRICT